MTAFTVSEKTKDYFPIEVVRLDTPPAPQIGRLPVEIPKVPIPVPQKPVRKPEPAPVSVKQDVAPPTAPTSPTPQPQEIGLDDKAPPVAEPTVSPSSGAESTAQASLDAQMTAEAPTGGVSFLPVTRLTKIPAFTRRTQPVYPETERMTGRESSVTAEVDLDEKGSIMEIRIVESGGKAFDSAIETALRKSLFTPGYIKNQPVPVRIQIPFVFKLR
jgi:TonB family protein